MCTVLMMFWTPVSYFDRSRAPHRQTRSSMLTEPAFALGAYLRPLLRVQVLSPSPASARAMSSVECSGKSVLGVQDSTKAQEVYWLCITKTEKSSICNSTQ